MAPDRPHHGLITEHRLARESGQHVRGHAHSRKNGDVNLRMAEEPEQVLPQQRRPARMRGDGRIGHHQPAGNEEARSRHAIEQQQQARGKQDPERQQPEDRRYQPCPHRQRHASQASFPLARRSTVVVMKFRAPSSDAMQKIARPITHKVCPAPSPGPVICPSALKVG